MSIKQLHHLLPGESAKLTIIFSGNVRKKLIAKYANLSPLKTASF
jgi:hypothetical protein